MDLSLLMSDSPERDTQINLFLARINIFVSYSLVIFIVGRQHDGKKNSHLWHQRVSKRKELRETRGKKEKEK